MKYILIAALLFGIFLIARRFMTVPSVMGRGEAARLLGVATDADSDTVLDAHRRLIVKVHPDAGGNAELAARINQARDVMLRP